MFRLLGNGPRRLTEFLLLDVVKGDESPDRILQQSYLCLFSLPKDFYPSSPFRNEAILAERQIRVIAVNQITPKEASIELKSDWIALFVTLTTSCPGTFDRNFIVLKPAQVERVVFRSVQSFELNVLADSLRIEHFFRYRHANAIGQPL